MNVNNIKNMKIELDKIDVMKSGDINHQKMTGECINYRSNIEERL
jgi:hypothetical protein